MSIRTLKISDPVLGFRLVVRPPDRHDNRQKHTTPAMIAYDLKCRQGHTFEGWFEDARAFQTQKKKGLLTCPVCSSAEVARLPSTFAIKNRPVGNRPPSEDAKKTSRPWGGRFRIMSRKISMMSVLNLPRKP